MHVLAKFPLVFAALTALLFQCGSPSSKESNQTESHTVVISTTPEETPAMSVAEQAKRIATTTDANERRKLLAWAKREKVAEAIPYLRKIYPRAPFSFEVFEALFALGDHAFLQKHPTDSIPYFREQVFDSLFPGFKPVPRDYYEDAIPEDRPKELLTLFFRYCSPKFLQENFPQKRLSLRNWYDAGGEELSVLSGDTLRVLKDWGGYRYWVINKAHAVQEIDHQDAHTLPLAPREEYLARVRSAWEVEQYSQLPYTTHLITLAYGVPAPAEIPMSVALFKFFAKPTHWPVVSIRLEDINADGQPEVFWVRQEFVYDSDGQWLAVYGVGKDGEYHRLLNYLVSLVEDYRFYGAWDLIDVGGIKQLIILNWHGEPTPSEYNYPRKGSMEKPVEVYSLQRDSLVELDLAQSPAAIAWVEHYIAEHPEIKDKIDPWRPEEW